MNDENIVRGVGEESNEIENHRHCQATVLSAYGPTGDGKTKDEIDDLVLGNLRQDWKDNFSENRNNITEDLAGILKVINANFGDVLKRLALGEQSIDKLNLGKPIVLTLTTSDGDKTLKFNTIKPNDGSEVYQVDIPGSDVKAGTGLTKTGNTISLQKASTSNLGGVKVGSGLSVDENGTLSATQKEIPIMNSTTAGIAKLGKGLKIESQALSVKLKNKGGLLIDDSNSLAIDDSYFNKKYDINVTHKNYYSQEYDENVGVTYGSSSGVSGEMLMISAIPKLSEGYNFCRFLGWDSYDDMPNGYSGNINYYDQEMLEPYGKVTSFNRLVKILDSNKTYTATFQPLSNPIYVCETEVEFNLCCNHKPSFKEVFDTWIRFGHNNEYQWKKDNSDGHNGYKFSVSGTGLKKESVNYAGGFRPGATAWTYDSTNDQILQPVNTTDFTGFVSRESYSSYKFTINCLSSDGDDDFNGIVAAFATDEYGMQHTLSFIRTPNSSNTDEHFCLENHWYVAIDLNAERTFNVGTKPGPVVGKWKGAKLVKSNTSLNSTVEKGGWSSFPNGVLISVERTGNVFVGKTNKFGDPSDVSTLQYDIRIDLDELTKDQNFKDYWWVLELFKGHAQIGYCTTSQTKSTYKNIDFVESESYIVYPPNDIVHNNVFKYNSSKSKWQTNGKHHSDPDVLGYASISRNTLTNRIWYYDGNKIRELKNT